MRKRFLFVTILHRMKISEQQKSGITITPGTRITNNDRFLSEFLQSNLFKLTAGIHSVDEFEDTVHYYIKGTVTDKMEPSTMLTFYYLRLAQSFVHELWEVKDNGVCLCAGWFFDLL